MHPSGYHVMEFLSTLTPHLAATPCMENHFPDGIMGGWVAGEGGRREILSKDPSTTSERERARARTVIIKCIREVFRNERVSSQRATGDNALSHNLGRLFLANISNREVKRSRKTVPEFQLQSFLVGNFWTGESSVLIRHTEH